MRAWLYPGVSGTLIVCGLLAIIGPCIAQPEAAGTPPESTRTWTLEECLQAALANNHARPASRFAIAVAEAQHRQVISSYWPQLALRGGAQWLDESPNFLFPASSITIDLQRPSAEAAGSAGSAGSNPPTAKPQGGSEAAGLTFPIPEQNVILMDPQVFLGSVNLTWLLWDFGMRKGLREQTNGQIDMLEHEARRTDLEIVDTVKRYYFGSVLASRIREVGQLTLERMQATLDLTETMYKEGSGTVKKTDYLDNLIMVESIRAMVAVLEKNEAMAQAALANSMGLAWNESARPADTEIPFEPVDADLESLVGSAYEFNPDWGKLQAALSALDGGIRTARSGHFPKVALVGDLHAWTNKLDSGMATDENKTGWTAGIMMEVPLFDGFLTSSRVAEARARRAEVNEKSFLLREGIGLMVKDAVLGLAAARKQHQATLDAKMAAEDNCDLNTRAYQNELVETGDVIRAQLMEAMMQVQHLKTRYDHAVLRSRLDFIVGTEVARALGETR